MAIFLAAIWFLIDLPLLLPLIQDGISAPAPTSLLIAVRAGLEALVRTNVAPDAVPAPSGRTNLARRRPCRTGVIGCTAARARGRARQRA
jgi:hypothetical protein